MRVVQFIKENTLVAAKVVDDNTLQIINVANGIYEAARACINNKESLSTWIDNNLLDETCSYDTVINDGRLLLPIIHPNLNECMVAGTGLTHLGSADTRNAMHDALSHSEESEMSDSMKMFKLGVDGGKPEKGGIGSQPEWFYKGDGFTLVPPGGVLPVPGFALDAGEEPELVGVYIIGDDQEAYRVGFAVGNEFSDHITEKGNYLWLAHSKLRYSSFGPELLVGDIPDHLEGSSKIIRDDEVIWKKEFLTGEKNMSHSLGNLEHHHFKYAQFCQPGMMHVHYFGTSTLSFGDNIETKNGDIFEISIPFFGRPLKNMLVKEDEEKLVKVNVL